MADGKPETPRGLDASGKWMFKFIAKAKWIKNVDSAEVKAICQLWSSYMKYHKLAKRNPEFHKQEYDALDRWHKLACRLGLNPVSRAQIKLDGEKSEQDEFAKFLSESG